MSKRMFENNCALVDRQNEREKKNKINYNRIIQNQLYGTDFRVLANKRVHNIICLIISLSGRDIILIRNHLRPFCLKMPGPI